MTRIFRLKRLLILSSFLLALLLIATVWAMKDKASIVRSDPHLKVTALSVGLSNIYVIEQENTIVMVDSGNPGHQHRIETLLQQQHIDPSKIDYLILTHGHFDHSGSAFYFQDKYGTKIIAHKGDEHLFTKGVRDETCPTTMLASTLKTLKSETNIDTIKADILVSHELDLTSLGINGRIIPYSGHTKGSLIIQVNDLLFVGDLIRGAIFDPTEPNVHWFMCDLNDNRNKIHQLLQQPAISTWYPGHLGPLSVDDINQFLNSF